MVQNKKIILSVLIIILFIVGFYLIFLKEKKPQFVLVEASRGDIVQEIFESGQVIRGEKVSLGFKSAGIIEKIHVQVGDEVEAGQALAELDVTDLEIQLQEARISFELAEMNLNKLLAGASAEEIKIAEKQAENAKIALEIAEQGLKNSYETALAVLDGSYPRIYNVLSFVSEFISSYLVTYDQDALKITLSRDKIEGAESRAKIFLAAARQNPSSSKDIEAALLTMKNSLETTSNNLEIIQEIVNHSTFYLNNVSAADKTSLGSLKTNANSAFSSVIGSQQAIAAAKLSIETAKINLQEAESRLDLIQARARQTDIDLYEAQIRQAKTRIQLHENQIKQAKLVSPIKGKVVETNKREGELAQPAIQDTVVVILPLVPYQIKSNIYEEDVVKINLGNLVEISLVAFPGKTFKGKIVAINPAEKLVEGVVYYETTIGFEENIEGLKPGLTADLVIEADLKENVLVIPSQAVQRKDGRIVAEIFKDGNIQEKRIEIGIRGNDDMVEIISGLEQGEKVIVY